MELLTSGWCERGVAVGMGKWGVGWKDEDGSKGIMGGWLDKRMDVCIND